MILNLFKILLIIWIYYKINYILELKILMLDELNFYTLILRMRFIEKVIIMQMFLKNIMNMWIILSIWKKMLIRLQIEKLIRIQNLIIISYYKISEKLIIMTHIVKDMIMKIMKIVITNFIEMKILKISLQNQKQIIRRNDTSLSFVIVVRKRNIMLMNASLLHW